MRIAAFLIIAAGLGVVSASAQASGSITGVPSIVYVSEFVSQTIQDDAILASFTDLFETALVSSGTQKVLNRRNLQKLLVEAQNESSVASMRDVSRQARVRIPALEGAQGVIFGVVTDDIASGEVSVAVTLEGFDSVIHWKRSVSMKRGTLRDLASRRETVEGLVPIDSGFGASRRNSGAPDATISRGAAGANPAPLSPSERIKATVDQFAMSPDRRRASLTVTLENLDREPVSLALDNSGRGADTPLTAAKVSLSDDRAGNWYLQSVAGLHVVPCCYRSLGDIDREAFTVLGPAARLRVVIVFSNDNNGAGVVRPYDTGFRLRTPGMLATKFSFSADALYSVASDPARFSIQLSSISASP